MAMARSRFLCGSGLRLHPLHVVDSTVAGESSWQPLTPQEVAVKIEADIDLPDFAEGTAEAVGSEKVSVQLKNGKLVLTPKDGGEAVAVPLLLAEVFRLGDLGLAVLVSKDAGIEGAEPVVSAWLLVASGASAAQRALAEIGALGAIRTDFDTEFEAEGPKLGEGMSAQVFRAKALKGGFAVAAKSFKSSMKPKDLKREVMVLTALQGHSCIVKFHGIFAPYSQSEPSTTRTVLAMELCVGDLHHTVVRTGPMREDMTRPMVQQLLQGLAHIHSCGFLHRDLKPDNVMLREDFSVVIADFGLACSVTDKDAMTRRCGSPGYIAPEVIQYRKVCMKSDLWSLGGVLFFMLCGRHAFKGSDTKSTLLKSVFKPVNLESPRFNYVSEECKEFIALLLAKDLAIRPDILGAAEHEWLRGSAVCVDDGPSKAKSMPLPKRKAAVVLGASELPSSVSSLQHSSPPVHFETSEQFSDFSAMQMTQARSLSRSAAPSRVASPHQSETPADRQHWMSSESNSPQTVRAPSTQAGVPRPPSAIPSGFIRKMSRHSTLASQTSTPGEGSKQNRKSSRMSSMVSQASTTGEGSKQMRYLSSSDEASPSAEASAAGPLFANVMPQMPEEGPTPPRAPAPARRGRSTSRSTGVLAAMRQLSSLPAGVLSALHTRGNHQQEDPRD